MKTYKNFLVALIGLSSIFTPFLAGAQLAPLSQSFGNTLQLLCYDFKGNLKSGDKGDIKSDAIRHLQFFLQNEGFLIPLDEYGVFGVSTTAAVTGFQEKYRNEILAPAQLIAGNGFVGKGTRNKLNSLYGCNGVLASVRNLKLNLGISNISLDSSGVSATFCNKSNNDVPSFPARLRLNGIVRDFEILGAHKAGSCDTESFNYNVWGLTYDPATTYAVVAAVDPNGFYKDTSVNIVPYGVASTTLSIPAIMGAHLSVRHLELKANGVQATFCNLGTVTLTSYPVRVAVNGTSKDFDVPGAYQAGKCSVITWGYEQWGLTYASGNQYSVSVVVDANNIYQESNEFDNSATIVGTP